MDEQLDLWTFVAVSILFIAVWHAVSHFAGWAGV